MHQNGKVPYVGFPTVPEGEPDTQVAAIMQQLDLGNDVVYMLSMVYEDNPEGLAALIRVAYEQAPDDPGTWLLKEFRRLITDEYNRRYGTTETEGGEA